MVVTMRYSPVFTADLSPAVREGPGCWSLHVLPLLKHVESVRWLEVGSYEGRSALWTIENVLRGPDAQIVCVDSWGELWGQENRQEAAFDHNLREYLDDGRAVKIKGHSRDVLPTMCAGSFHGIYVDGSHAEEDVYLDGVMAARLLAPGGVLVFDDYEGDEPDGCLDGDGRPRGGPRLYGVHQAVERLRAEWGRAPEGEKIRPLWLGYQAIFQKAAS
jgi:hypothetical protein